MPDNNLALQQEDRVNSIKSFETTADDLNILNANLSGMLGHVNFDGQAADNTISEAMISAEHRKRFRREVYVGIKDTEQNIEFLGRIVQGPFHRHHPVDADSTKKRPFGSPKRLKRIHRTMFMEI
jgi:hypothetical protein